MLIVWQVVCPPRFPSLSTLLVCPPARRGAVQVVCPRGASPLCKWCVPAVQTWAPAFLGREQIGAGGEGQTGGGGLFCFARAGYAGF